MNAALSLLLCAVLVAILVVWALKSVLIVTKYRQQMYDYPRKSKIEALRSAIKWAKDH